LTKLEVGKILAIIAAAYDRFEINEFKQQLWLEMLQDVPYQVAQVALKKLILESPFPPSIADIRKQIVEVTTPQENKKDSGQAWGEVMKAISSHGIYQPEKALASMSETTRKVAERIGWREICMQEEDKMGVLRGQFMKIYDSLVLREKQDALLPANILEQIQSISNKGKEIRQIG
jgi:hypothetical protein